MMTTLSAFKVPLFGPETEAGAAAPPADPASAGGSPSSLSDGSSAPASPSGGGAPAAGNTKPDLADVDGEGENFETMGSNEDLDELNSIEVTLPPDASAAPAVVPPAATASPPASSAPPAPPVPAAAAAQPTAAQPTAQPGSPPAADASQPSPAGEPQGAQAPASLLDQMSQHREALIGEIAAKQFAMTKEEADALEVDLHGTVPKLLARVYYDSVTATLAHIQRTVPQIVQQQVNLMRAADEAENAFYGMFPGLDRAKHAADVNQFAQAFRTNPNITQKDLFSMVGAAVMAKHGLTMTAQAAAQPSNGRSPPARTSTPAFVPARPGASVTTHPIEDNPFAGLGQDLDDE